MMKRRDVVPITWYPPKCHRNVFISEDGCEASCSNYGFGGVMANWVLGPGSHYWEVKILKCRMGMGVYLGVADSEVHPHLRGNGMSASQIPAKSCFEYKGGFAYHCGSGDLYNGGKVVRHTGIRSRKNDVISMVFNGDKGVLTYFKNGTEIGRHTGISGDVSPVVDLSLGAAVDLLRPGCYSTGSVRESTYQSAPGKGPRKFEEELTTRGEPEATFSAAVGQIVNQQVLESTSVRHYADIEEANSDEENYDDLPIET